MNASAIQMLTAERDHLKEMQCAHRAERSDSGYRRTTKSGEPSDDSEVVRLANLGASRLFELERTLSEVRPAPPVTQTKYVQFGSYLRVLNLNTGDERLLRIGGSGEPAGHPHIVTTSNVSPTGRALIKASVGRKVSCDCPNSQHLSYQVLEISIEPFAEPQTEPLKLAS